jgi:predicted enzyme related to lactoylglutathione lyase
MARPAQEIREMLLNVKFVSVPCLDQDRALAFYTEKLGLRVISDQPYDDGQRWIELRIEHAETRFVLFTPPGTKPGWFQGALACDNVEATHRQLSQRGVHFVKEPQKSTWGTFAIFEDSEGNQFVLSSRS